MSQRQAGNSTDDSYLLRRIRREQARQQAMQLERADSNGDIDMDSAEEDGEEPNARYELWRRRRGQARVHARALAREGSWEEVYMANTETDDQDEDEISRFASNDGSRSSASGDGGIDIISQVIAMGRPLVQTLSSREPREINGLINNVVRPLQRLQEGLRSQERRELNEHIGQRLHLHLEPRATSQSTNDSGSESGDGDSAYVASTAAFDPPTRVPVYRRRDSSDSASSSAASGSRYVPDSDSDTGTYDRELYGVTTANLNYEGGQWALDQYIEHGERLRRGRPQRRSVASESGTLVPAPSIQENDNRRHGLGEASNTRSVAMPGLVEIMPRLSLPLARAIRRADYLHNAAIRTGAMPSTESILQGMLPAMPSSARSAVGNFIDQCNSADNLEATNVRFDNFEQMESDMATADVNITDVLAFLEGIQRARIEDTRRTDEDVRAFEAQMALPITGEQRCIIRALNRLVLEQWPLTDPSLRLSLDLSNTPGISDELLSDLTTAIVQFHQDPDQMWSSELWEALAVNGVNIDDIIATLEQENQQRYNGEPLRAERDLQQNAA